MSRLGKLLVLAIVIAAGVVLLVAEYFGGSEERGAPAAAQSVSNRPHLRVCVQGTRGLTDSGSELEAVQRALVSLRAQYGTEESSEAEAVSGCPPARVLSEAPPRSENELHALLYDAIGIRAPDLPSPNRLFVYIVRPDVYAEYFGAARWAIAPAEMYCSGHSCGEVTTAVYLPAGAGEEEAFESLKRALGLYVYPPAPTPDLTVCLQEDPPYWCSQFPPEFLPGSP